MDVTVMMLARVPEIAAVTTMNFVAVSNHLFCLDQAPTWTSLYTIKCVSHNAKLSSVAN